MSERRASIRSDRLGVQAHCLRHEIASGLEGALERVAGLGPRAIRLMSFPGFHGQAWGDFGAAPGRTPRPPAAATWPLP